MAYKYFIYSKEQFDEQTAILAKRNKRFVPGIVVVNGSRKQFTQISSTASIPRFIDAQIVAEGEERNFKYEKPTTERRLS